LRNNFIQRLISKIVKCNQLVEIQIDNYYDIYKETEVCIKEFIINCENLISLNLSYFNLFSKGNIENFSEGLKNLKYLKHLDISGNKIKNADELTPKDIYELLNGKTS
jgi:hypothetical protein